MVAYVHYLASTVKEIVLVILPAAALVAVRRQMVIVLPIARVQIVALAPVLARRSAEVGTRERHEQRQADGSSNETHVACSEI